MDFFSVQFINSFIVSTRLPRIVLIKDILSDISKPEKYLRLSCLANVVFPDSPVPQSKIPNTSPLVSVTPVITVAWQAGAGSDFVFSGLLLLKFC